MTRERWNGIFAAGVACVVLNAAPVAAGTLTPEQKCAAKKLTAQAKDTDQEMKAYTKKKFLEEPDPKLLQKAEDKLTDTFTKAEEPGACKVEGDAPKVAAMVDMIVQEVTQAVRPPTGPAATKPEQKCAVMKAVAASTQAKESTKCQVKNLSTPSSSLLDLCVSQAKTKTEDTFKKAEEPGGCATTGDAPVVVGKIDTFVKEISKDLVPPTPTPTAGPSPTPCTGFVDNGDGTITDCDTHLMWEKKDNSGGIHDFLNTYTWSSSGTAADGTVFTSFIHTLNTPPCFAGHCDWRLPTIAGYGPGASGQPAELETIVDPSNPQCVSNDFLPCVASVFDSACTMGCNATSCSCTAGHEYWSASTVANQTNGAWLVFFDDGTVFGELKSTPIYARAVRSIP